MRIWGGKNKGTIEGHCGFNCRKCHAGGTKAQRHRGTKGSGPFAGQAQRRKGGELCSAGLRRLALVGNPNVGKSVIFGELTGRYAVVSNYPGTTVEVSRGHGLIDGHVYDITDTPGINSLTPLSEDERVTRDWLLHNRPEAVLQVADAKNMYRTIMLSLQLAEMGMPMVMALNMQDEARNRGIEVDAAALQSALGIKVIPTVAVEGSGLQELRRAVATASRAGVAIEYDQHIEDALSEFESILASPDGASVSIDSPGVTLRSLGLMYLCGDPWLAEWLGSNYGSDKMERLEDLAQGVRAAYNRPLDYVIAQCRLKAADDIVKRIVTRGAATENIGQWLGDLTTRPLTGIPIFLAVIYLVFKLVGQFGAGTLVDLIETNLFGNHILPWLSAVIKGHLPWPLLQDALIGKYGLISMGLTYAIAIVMPIVGTFFLAFGLLEDSGYLPRLTVMANRVFRLIGLNGKAVLPMVLGLGCATMATLTTRILDSRKERLIATILLALGIPCSAQLGVMLGMTSWLSVGAMMFVVAVVGFQLFVVGWLASMILPGERSDFIQELPPIRWPQISNIVIKTLLRVKWFLAEAVPYFLAGTLLLFTLDATGAMGAIIRVSAPVVSGMLGLPDKAVEFFILGFMRRDYGAAGLYDLARQGILTRHQMIVSLVTITLFVPCVANFFIIIKERGLATALAIVAFILPYAILNGWLVRLILSTGVIPL
ncbi:MAG: ferrous iron transport protein B [bacterium]|nr:ferrous iron transport protein B [bacterium]